LEASSGFRSLKILIIGVGFWIKDFMAVVSVGTNFRFEMKGRMMGSLCFTCSIIRRWTPNMEWSYVIFISQRQRKNKEPGAGLWGHKDNVPKSYCRAIL
jgi:hypothetical protein